MNDQTYRVLENAPVLLCKDVQKIFDWFGDALGWKGTMDERDADGIALYGCVYPYLPEKQPYRPFLGLHLMIGDPKPGYASLLKVREIEKLYAQVSKGGFTISPVLTEPWGAKSCEITTPEGHILKVFESIDN